MKKRKAGKGGKKKEKGRITVDSVKWSRKVNRGRNSGVKEWQKVNSNCIQLMEQQKGSGGFQKMDVRQREGEAREK